MSKLRVNDMAGEFGISVDEVITLLRQMDVPVRSHVSPLTDDQVARIRARWEREKRARATAPAALRTSSPRALRRRPPHLRHQSTRFRPTRGGTAVAVAAAELCLPPKRARAAGSRRSRRFPVLASSTRRRRQRKQRAFGHGACCPIEERGPTCHHLASDAAVAAPRPAPARKPARDSWYSRADSGPRRQLRSIAATRRRLPEATPSARVRVQSFPAHRVLVQSRLELRSHRRVPSRLLHRCSDRIPRSPRAMIDRVPTSVVAAVARRASAARSIRKR